jgi:gamma-glutamyl phosphate reductase
MSKAEDIVAKTVEAADDFRSLGQKNTDTVVCVALILAPGTDSLVREAHASGTPVIGVGPGNVPVCIGISADIPFAVQNIIDSKTFDGGSVCASELDEKTSLQSIESEFNRDYRENVRCAFLVVFRLKEDANMKSDSSL